LIDIRARPEQNGNINQNGSHLSLRDTELIQGTMPVNLVMQRKAPGAGNPRKFPVNNVIGGGHILNNGSLALNDLQPEHIVNKANN